MNNTLKQIGDRAIGRYLDNVTKFLAQKGCKFLIDWSGITISLYGPARKYSHYIQSEESDDPYCQVITKYLAWGIGLGVQPLDESGSILDAIAKLSSAPSHLIEIKFNSWRSDESKLINLYWHDYRPYRFSEEQDREIRKLFNSETVFFVCPECNDTGKNLKDETSFCDFCKLGDELLKAQKEWEFDENSVS